MKSRPIAFAVECVVAMAIAVFGAWLAAKAGHKLNAKANGDIRAAAAQERIAEAVEAIEHHGVYCSTDSIDPRAIERELHKKRRHVTAKEDAFITAHQECWNDAYVGADDEVHPDYCRP